ncbi:MAG TPA: hypothetical protein VH599_00660 [Ktedonobacterales bacterium]
MLSSPTTYRGLPLVAPPSWRLNAGLLVRWPGGERSPGRSGGRLEGGATSTMPRLPPPHVC